MGRVRESIFSICRCVGHGAAAQEGPSCPLKAGTQGWKHLWKLGLSRQSFQSDLENNEGDLKAKGKTEKGGDLGCALCELGGSVVPASHAGAWDCAAEKMRALMERDPRPGSLCSPSLPQPSPCWTNSSHSPAPQACKPAGPVAGGNHWCGLNPK